MGLITVDAEDENGTLHEVLVDSANPPKCGEWFEEDGMRLMRLPSLPNARVKNYTFKSYQLPRRKDVAKHGYAKAPAYDKDGFAVFESKRQVSDYVAKHNENGKGGHIAWDPDGNE